MCLLGRAPAPAPAGAIPNGDLHKGSSDGALEEPEPFYAVAGGATKPSFSGLLLRQGAKGRDGPPLIRGTSIRHSKAGPFSCACT